VGTLGCLRSARRKAGAHPLRSMNPGEGLFSTSPGGVHFFFFSELFADFLKIQGVSRFVSATMKTLGGLLPALLSSSGSERFLFDSSVPISHVLRFFLLRQLRGSRLFLSARAIVFFLYSSSTVVRPSPASFASSLLSPPRSFLLVSPFRNGLPPWRITFI